MSDWKFVIKKDYYFFYMEKGSTRNTIDTHKISNMTFEESEDLEYMLTKLKN